LGGLSGRSISAISMLQQPEFFIPRRARQRLEDGQLTEPWPLSHWRDQSAYVLLGDPGMGKTTALTAEATAAGVEVISATDFGIVQADKKKAKPAICFIDALDERRVETATEFEALETIRNKLDALGRPKFRITCREIDWRGGVDLSALKAVSPDGQIAELHLEPLNEEEVQTLLKGPPCLVANPAEFWRHLVRLGLEDWLRNPMALKLILKATQHGGIQPLSNSKTEIFRLACEQLATEQNDHHRAAKRKSPPKQAHVLEDAGKLCALLLLSGRTELHPLPDLGANSSVPLDFPPELVFHRPHEAIATALFTTEGGRSKPIHRTVAEYLGAVQIGKLVVGGLPVSRVLALMSGQDGGIVEPLRGLHAWMAVTCPRERATLIERDPLGVVMYGDVRGFSAFEKQQIFEALAREADRYAWFRSGTEFWNAHPFGSLGTQDMVPAMKEILGRADRGIAHQAMLACVLDAIRYGDKLPDVLNDLEAIVEDNQLDRYTRHVALRAWLAQSKPDISSARGWLDAINEGRMEDPEDSLRGDLLKELYPRYVGVGEVKKYLSDRKQKNHTGSYEVFRSHYLFERTPPGKFGELADAVAAMPIARDQLYLDFSLQRLVAKVIVAALKERGVSESVDRIISWLRIGRGNYDDVVLKDGDAKEIGNWLADHPEVLKRVYIELCCQEIEKFPPERPWLWSASNLLYGARYPRDWYNWLLEVATDSHSEVLAKFYFSRAAAVALEAAVDFNIRMEEVEDWVEAHQATWPKAAEWLSTAWSMRLSQEPHWQQHQFLREKEHQAEQLAARQTRAKQFAELFATPKDGMIAAGGLHTIALAYKGRYFDIRGETPEARLQDLVGGGAEQVETALRHLSAALQRTDLPSVKDILASGLASKEHFVRPACLIAGDLAFAENSEAILTWPEELLKRLVAFWLTDGTDNEPAWYAAVIRFAPQWAADVMVPYALQVIRRGKSSSPTGLWALARKADLASFARIVIPLILEKFPVRANEVQWNLLVDDLLPAALRHLERNDLGSIIKRRLANKSMDAGQRIAWLSLGTFQNDRAMGKALVKFLGKSQTRVQHLLRALTAQVDREMNHLNLALDTQSLMIELLAPHCSPARPEGFHWVGPPDRCRDQVRAMIHNLARIADAQASNALQHLRTLPQLKAWWPELDHALFESTRVTRAAHFTHASPQAVALMLANRTPANPADLQALMVDHLYQLEKEIRGSDANLLGQFWSQEGSGGQQSPLLENDCRDRLLALLRSRLLPLAVALDKEGQVADDKRMDLRASIQGQENPKRLPTEIKKDTDANVWTAWRDQLDLKYLNDPSSGGYGIYLVLWFGQRPTALDGIRPDSAKLMKSMLQGKIPAADRTRIAVVVMDLSNKSSVSQ
jgi:hypothetical protein